MMTMQFVTVPDHLTNQAPKRKPRRADPNKAMSPCVVYRPDETGELKVAEVLTKRSKRVSVQGE